MVTLGNSDYRTRPVGRAALPGNEKLQANDGHGGAGRIDSRFTWRRINQTSQETVVVPLWNFRVTRSYLDNKRGSTMLVARLRKHRPCITQVLE